MFINGGVDLKLNLVLTCERALPETANIIRKLSENIISKESKDLINNLIEDRVKISEAEQNRVKDEISMFNIAPRVGIGFQFFDRLIAVNFFVRYWFIEEMDIQRGDNGEFSEFLGAQFIPIESMKMNRLVDLYTSLEIDLIPLFRKNNSPEILD